MGERSMQTSLEAEEVEFTDVNNSSKRPRLEDFNFNNAFIQKLESTTAPSKDDITVNDSAHSPVIPIPVSSTPASAFISDPPSSSPKVFLNRRQSGGDLSKKRQKNCNGAITSIEEIKRRKTPQKPGPGCPTGG